MIKELISDLTFDKIILNQALTRAKIIAHKVQNDNFKEWISKELEGYQKDDISLPDYTRIYCPITITVEYPYYEFKEYPVVLSPEKEKEKNLEVSCIFIKQMTP